MVVTSLSGSRNGSGRIRTESTTAKMTTLALTQSASVSTATAVKPGFFSNWRKANFRSFITQCLHRIYFCCASRGNQAGEECDAQQDQRRRRERERIVRFHIVEQARDEPCERERTGETEHAAERCQREALPHDEREHIAHARTQRHAHADL